MLSLVGWAGAILLAAGLLRVILGRGAGRPARGGSAGSGPARDGTRGNAAGLGGPGRARPESWRLHELLPPAALALAVLHGWLALRVSPFVVLLAVPAYLAAVILMAISRRRLKRKAAAGSPTAPLAAAAPPPRSRGIARRLVAAGALALLALSVARLVELHALRTAASAPAELRRQERDLDLGAKSWPEAFGALCDDLAVRYPFTAWKGIDWRTLRRRRSAHRRGRGAP
jgi:hypothetical protein